MPESDAIELKRGEMEPGDVLIEVTNERAVLERVLRWECEPVPKR